MNCQPLPQRTKQLDPYSNYLEKQGYTAFMCVTLRAAPLQQLKEHFQQVFFLLFIFRSLCVASKKTLDYTTICWCPNYTVPKKQKSHSSILLQITIITHSLPIIKLYSKVHNQCIDIYGKCKETQPQIENKTKQVIFWYKKFCP